jgi:APA family basic amino acid/polyamine antiporter
MGILPAEVLAKSHAPFADAAEVFWGKGASYLVAIGAIISTMGGLNGWLLMQGQIPMAAAQDELFPKVFQRKNKNGAPAIGIVLSSILVSVLMMINYHETLVSAFTFMMTLSTLSVITPYIFSTACFVLFLPKNEKRYDGNYIISFLAFCFSLWIIVGCGKEVVFYGFLLLMLGIPVYVCLRRGQKK